jgi:hypothetical protein
MTFLTKCRLLAITRGMQVHKTDSTLRTLGFSRSRSPTVQELNMSSVWFTCTRRSPNALKTTRCQAYPRDEDVMHVESKRRRYISISSSVDRYVLTAINSVTQHSRLVRAARDLT